MTDTAIKQTGKDDTRGPDADVSPVQLRKPAGRERGAKKHIRSHEVSIVHQLMIKQREMMRSELDQYYISKGLSIEVELTGPDKTSITFLSPLFHRDAVRKIVEGTDLFLYLREAGFRKAIIGDSNEDVWTYNLSAP
jgi:hypothetical protein